MSFLRYINKNSIEKLIKNKLFKNWLYSKRWFEDKSQLLNLEFNTSLVFFEFLTENICLTVIKVKSIDYEKQYFLPLAFFKEKHEINANHDDILEMKYKFPENENLGESEFIIIEAEFLTNFWKNLFIYKNRYKELQDLSIEYKDKELEQKIVQLLSSDKTEFKLKLQQLGKGNTTNLIFKIKISSNTIPFNSYVIKSYRGFSENLEPITLEILTNNRFLNIPKINAVVNFRGKTIISFMNFIQNQGNIGEIFWNEINNLVYSIVDKKESFAIDFHDNLVLNELIKNKCSNSINISNEICELFLQFHEAMISDNNRIYSLDIVEKEYFLRNFSQKLILIIPEINLNKDKIPFINPLEIQNLLDKVSSTIKSLCSNLEKTEIKIQEIHQDLHMEQILYNKKDKTFFYYITDFEGDPNYNFKEKQQKFPKERDIASFLRSFSYIKYNTLLELIKNRYKTNNFANSEDYLHDFFFGGDNEKINLELENILELLNSWESLFINKIIKTPEYDHKLINFFIIDRILHEIKYEIKYRPSKVIIPLLGLKEYLAI